MTDLIRPLIMCGGSGTRLWPVSRDSMPKQFSPLLGLQSTFQETVKRVSDATLFGKPLIVANVEHAFIIQRQLKEIGVEADLLLEPFGQDSAPAIVAGSLLIAESDPRTLVLVLAADHLVRDVAGFHKSVRDGVAAAKAGYIVTHGIVPTYPATGYGYIERGDPIDADAAAVKAFIEKPDAHNAARFVLAGYLWNSGNFLFKAETLLAEYGRFDPDSLSAATAAVQHRGGTLSAPVLNADDFRRTTKRSIDYAVMDRTALAANVKAAFDWSDVGTWDALWDVGEKDADGNVQSGNTKLLGSSENFVSSSGQLTTLIGVSKLIVVATQDAILIAAKDRSGEVKDLVNALKAEKRAEATQHPVIHRPWGWFQTLDVGARFKVRRVVVYPQGQQSMMMHHHRAEHWIIVKGTAEIIIGDRPQIVAENESVYIPLGHPHRLRNPGLIDLEIIEVQTGSYLNEHDIVRLEDSDRPLPH